MTIRVRPAKLPRGRSQHYVERLASRDAFSGTVLLAKAGKPLYHSAFGETTKDFGVPNTFDTKFNLG